MASANAAGGVMGKMIAAPSIVVASTATQTYGQEGTILRFVFFHSLALAALAGICVSLLAYVPLLRRLGQPLDSSPIALWGSPLIFFSPRPGSEGATIASRRF